VSRVLGAALLRRVIRPLQDDMPQPAERRVWAAFLAGIAMRLYLVKAGVGSYFLDPSAAAGALPYVQFALLIEGLSMLAVLVYFCALLRGRGFSRWRFGLMFAIELATVFLLGFKGQIAFRFIYLTIAYVLIRRRVPWTLVAAGIGMLVLVFPVNIAIRTAFGQGGVQAGNLTSIAGGYAAATQQVQQGSPLQTMSDSVRSIAYNSGQLEPFAMVVQYINTGGDEQHGVEYLAPITSLIPRALWPSKPVVTYGGFVNTVIYGHGGMTSIAQSVPGDFYLNGGWLAVLLGFAVVGAVERILLPLVREATSLRYLPLICLLVVQFGMLNSDLGAGLAGTLRLALFSALALRVVVPAPEEERMRRYAHASTRQFRQRASRRHPSPREAPV
jgi:hypothetical protein